MTTLTLPVMDVQPVPALTPVPHFPALTERALGTYNLSSYNFGNHLHVTFGPELLALCGNVHHNAQQVQAVLSSLGDYSTGIALAVTTATDAADAAEQAKQAALAYAQAAQAAAGVPQPTPFGVYAADGVGHPDWRDLAALPAMLAKADKDGAVVTRLSTNRIAYAPAAGATQVLDVSLAGEFVITPAGSCNLVWANVPPGNVSFMLTLDCVNFANKTIGFSPGTLFVKADRTTATSAGNAGITFQTAGTDFLMVWFKNGVPYVKVF